MLTRTRYTSFAPQAQPGILVTYIELTIPRIAYPRDMIWLHRVREDPRSREIPRSIVRHHVMMIMMMLREELNILEMVSTRSYFKLHDRASATR
jgi:hypothetical protein